MQYAFVNCSTLTRLSVGAQLHLGTLKTNHSRQATPKMQMPTRRRFIEITPYACLAILAACSPKVEPPVATTPAPSSAPAAAPAQAPLTIMNLQMVERGDAQAVTFGYVDDATQADTVKFKNYVSGSACSNCALYQGKAGDVAGGCPLFTGKNVAAKGWCTSWSKKA